MTGLNHGLTGGLLAEVLPFPIALPLAFVSHFILDAFPHYGIPHRKRNKSTFWKIFFTFDTLATFSLAIYAIVAGHYKVFLCGLVATMPDYIWVGRVVRAGSFDLSQHDNWFNKWHAGIQKLEKPWGLWLELPLTVVLFYIVMIRLW
jgi:hypothetical protein